MNLLGLPPYQKGARLTKKPNRPTAEQRRAWNRIIALGCIVSDSQCRGRITIHHAGTGGGGRKDHDKVLPLCEFHHQGEMGIDGGRISKREWQAAYGSEESLLALVRERLA